MNYEDFYAVYFDMAGNPIYPTDLREISTVKSIIKKAEGKTIAFVNEGRTCYKINLKMKVLNGVNVQAIEITNITEYINEINKASIDTITHLNTRRMARNMFLEYIEYAYNNQEDFAVILADVDNFKEMNDTYGHTNGDIILSEMSRILYCSTRQEKYRDPDIVARLGGDEFILVLKNVSESFSTNRAEQIRSDVESKKIELYSEAEDKEIINLGTMSMGIYYVSFEDLKELFDKGYSIDEVRMTLIDRCDSALYKSKNNGRNKVTSYSEIFKKR